MLTHTNPHANIQWCDCVSFQCACELRMFMYVFWFFFLFAEQSSVAGQRKRLFFFKSQKEQYVSALYKVSQCA